MEIFPAQFLIGVNYAIQLITIFTVVSGWMLLGYAMTIAYSKLLRPASVHVWAMRPRRRSKYRPVQTAAAPKPKAKKRK